MVAYTSHPSQLYWREWLPAVTSASPLCLVIQTAWPQQIKPRSCYGSSCWGLNSWPNGCCSAVMLPITRHRGLNVIGSPISSNSSDISKATCLPQQEAAVLVIFNSRILEFLTSGSRYRGNLLFYRTSCRRASNPWVRKMTSGAYHLSHNNFESLKNVSTQMNQALGMIDHISLQKESRLKSFICYCCVLIFPC